MIDESESERVELQTTYFGLTLNEFDTKYGRHSASDVKPSLLSHLHTKLHAIDCSWRRMFSFVEHRVPAVKLLHNYKLRSDLLGDIVSGLSVGVMTIPQSMGYALLAAVPGHYGLYTSLFPVIVYFFFGTSRHVSIGTMALSSLVIRSAVEHANIEINSAGNDTITSQFISQHPYSVHVAMSVSLTAGLFLLIMSFLQLGFIVSYMSESFISGYLAASNILVLTHQVKLILGVPTGQRAGPMEFFFLVYDIFSNIQQTNLLQLLMSVISIAALVLVKQCINERFKSRMLIPVPIDLIIVIIATIICHFGGLHQFFNVQVLTEIPRGIPVPVIPSPSIMYRYLFEGFMLAVVSYMMVAMMAILFAQRHDYQVDNNQELAANGLACILGSFVNSLAASTSPPRCFLMESTGGRTQVTYIISATLVLITLLAIAPLFQSLPVCILASIVIVACIPLFVHYTMWLTYWRTDRYDLSIWIVTFLMTFIAGVDYGLVIGVGYSMVIVHFRLQHSQSYILLPSSDASCVLLNSKQYSGVSLLINAVIFQFNAPIYFATKANFKESLFAKTVSPNMLKYQKAIVVQYATEANNTEANHVDDENRDVNEINCLKPVEVNKIQVIVINCCSVSFMDTDGAKMIAQLHQDYKKHGVRLVLACCQQEVLSRLKCVEQCGPLLVDSVFPSVHDALLALNIPLSNIVH